MILQPSDVIETPGPWPTQHRGIFWGVDVYGQAWVIHNPKGGCVRYDLLHDFASGQSVTLVRRIARNVLEQRRIISRAHSQLGKPYDLVNFNCDHLVTFAISGIATSP